MKSKRPWPHLLFTCAVILACATPAPAVQFRILGWSANDYNLQLDQGRDPITLQISSDGLSPVYDATGAQSVVLYKMVDDEGKPRKHVACTVTVPPELTHGVLILIPATNQPLPALKVLPNKEGFVSPGAPLTYDYLWLDDSLEARPLGMIEFRNMSRLPIAFQIGDKEGNLAPQGKMQTPLIEGAKRLRFKAAVQLAEKWQVFACSPLPTRGPSRLLIIFREVAEDQRTDPDDPGIRMIRLYDAPIPVVATPPPAQ